MKLLPWQKVERTLPMLFLTESRRIVDDICLPVWKAYVADEKRQEGWLTWPEALIPNASTGRYHLLASERSMVPLLLKGKPKGRDKKPEDLICQIAAESAEEAHFNNEDQAKKSFRDNVIGISILALVLLIVVMVIAGLVNSGTLRLPG